MEQPRGYIDTVMNGQVVPLTIESHQIISQENIAQNIAINLGRNIPRFVNTSGRCILRKDEALAIVSCGHSLNDQIEELRSFKNILVCGSAHDHVVRQGIIPTYAVVCDAGKEDKLNLSLSQKETLYLIASQCDPGLFEHLEDNQVEMWHYRGQSTSDPEEEAKILQGETPIAWGSTVTMVSIHIAVLLGFQHLHFFGFDNCYSEYGVNYHACDISGGIEYEKKPVTVGENKRFFITNLALMAQVEQFFQLIEAWHQWIHVTVHGDGLVSEMIKQGEPGLSDFVSLA